jgi:hypothetical protein
MEKAVGSIAALIGGIIIAVVLRGWSTQWPLPAFLGFCVLCIIALLSIAALIDRRRARQRDRT